LHPNNIFELIWERTNNQEMIFNMEISLVIKTKLFPKSKTMTQ